MTFLRRSLLAVSCVTLDLQIRQRKRFAGAPLEVAPFSSNHCLAFSSTVARRTLQFHRDDFVHNPKNKISEDYALDCSLGKGSFGKVYQATHKRSQAKRAIKIIPKAGTKSEEFRNELDILSSLDHPHIIKLIEFYESAQNYYLVEDLCAGTTLIDFLFPKIPDDANLGVSERDVSIVIRQCLKAVLCCHANGVVHRDIKLENFIVSSLDKSVQMIDFGISARFVPSENVRGLVGTYQYMAPEVLFQRHGRGYGTSADIWSLGVVLYMLLTGEKLFPTTDAFDVGGSHEVYSFGKWLPMKIVKKGPDNTYTVEVQDGTKTILPNIKEKCLRHTNVQKRKDLERKLHDSQHVLRKIDTAVKRKNLSKDARNLLVTMLEHDPKKRITAAEALSHRFVLKYANNHLGDTMHNVYNSKEVLARMQKFAHAPRLKRIAFLAMTHLISCHADNHELLTLQHLFRMINTDGEGHISPGEFKSFLTIEGTKIPANFDEIWNCCDSLADAEKSGLSYVEFIASNFPDSLINEKTCKEAFLLIDQCHNGLIGVDDLNLLFRSTKHAEDDYSEIIKEAEARIRKVKTAPEGSFNFADFHHLLRQDVAE